MKIELWAIARVKPYPNNPRINDSAVDVVVASLREFKFRQPIVADTGGQRRGKRHTPSWRSLEGQRARGIKPPRKTEGPRKKTTAKGRRLLNDFVSDEQFAKSLLARFDNIARALEPRRIFYLWGGYANLANYPPALAATELFMSQCLIWVKGHPVITRKDYMGDHEWCFYGWRKGAAHKFFGANNLTDLWHVK